jgi:hypothetical protein
LGAPVVPDEYIINRGWLKGTCSKYSSTSGSMGERKSSRRQLNNNKNNKVQLYIRVNEGQEIFQETIK